MTPTREFVWQVVILATAAFVFLLVEHLRHQEVVPDGKRLPSRVEANQPIAPRL
jgi:hypothetical protein